MNNREIAEKVLELLGSKSNVSSVATCMTRLRVGVKDNSLINIDEIKKIEGVLGLVEADTIQVIFGPGKVNKVGVEFSLLTGISIGSEEDSNVSDIAKQNKINNKAKYNGPVQRFLTLLAGVFIPLLPAIIAGGLINGLANFTRVTLGAEVNNIWWFSLISTIGWGVFYYLPIFVGMNAAKQLKGTPVIGAVAGIFAITNPAMPLLAKNDLLEPLILMPLTDAAFNPAAGGLIAAVIGGFIFAMIEVQLRKVMPEILDTFFTPLITLIIGAFLMLFIFQPVGAFLTTGIYNVMFFVYDELGVFGGFILSAGFLPLVSVGLHQALTPIHTLLNDPEGATNGVNFLLPILMMAGGGQVGAALALYVKTKNKKLKNMIRNSVPVGILGIGEPLMYAVTLPLGRSFITACIGSGLGGMLAVIFGLGSVAFGVSGLFGLLIMQPGQQLAFFIAMLGAYAGGFLVTYFFGVDEERINAVYGE